MARQQYYSVLLRPKSSRAPTFYDFGPSKNFSLTGRMTEQDVEKVVRKFNRTPYKRDYEAVIHRESPVLTPEWEAEDARREHENLESGFTARMKRLASMYYPGKQPTGGSPGNSPI